MTKPLKFHRTLNLPPRSITHGKHRRASPPVHGDPIVGADHSAGGTDPGTDHGAAWVTITPGNFSWTVVGTSTFCAEPPAVPYAGIRTGELIGHRLWWVIPYFGEEWICSLAHRRLWLPGEAIRGDLSRIVAPDFLCPIYGGVYAFASPEHLAPEVSRIEQVLNACKMGGIFRLSSWMPYHETSTFVAGTVKMWGDVVEHQHGYRAEFAKLRSIDVMYGPGDIDALRARYGVSAFRE